MKGDFSRFTFNAKKRYVGTLMQQGRVQLDADWNEQQAIHRYHRETSFTDVIGPAGVPRDSKGFEIGVSEGGTDLTISGGRIYVDGICCENLDNTTLLNQPFLKFSDSLVKGRNLVYLDVWERHVSAVEAPELLEKALGGVDTTTRVQIVWQVKLAKVDDNKTCEAFPADWKPENSNLPRMHAKKISSGEASPCEMAPVGGYKGLGNQLYRVEVHNGGSFGTATIKWSRDNGTVVTSVNKIDGTTIFVESTGRDEVLGFSEGQWVELIDRERELKGECGLLFKIDKVDYDKREITIINDGQNLTFKQPIMLRRWDNAPSSEGNGIPVKNKTITLDGAIDVTFDEQGTYFPGDYWLIAARSAMGGQTGGSIEWPSTNGVPDFREPDGTKHHYCPLALVDYDNNKQFTFRYDCRELFPPLTDITANDVSFDGDDCEFPPDVNNVQYAIDWLCKMKRDVGCAAIIDPGNKLSAKLKRFNPEKDRSINICLKPGVHNLGTLSVNARESIKITGSGASIIVVKGELTLSAPVIIIRDVNFEFNEQSSLYIEISNEEGQVDVNGCRFARASVKEFPVPLVAVGGKGNMSWINNRMRACKIDIETPKNIFPGIPAEILDSIVETGTKVAVGKLDDALKIAEEGAKKISRIPAGERKIMVRDQPKGYINALPDTKESARSSCSKEQPQMKKRSLKMTAITSYEKLNLPDIQIGDFAGLILDLTKDIITFNDVALSLKTNEIGGWIVDNQIDGNVVLMSELEGEGHERLHWTFKDSEEKGTVMKIIKDITLISPGDDLIFRGNIVNTVYSIGLEKGTVIQKAKTRGFRSLTISDNTFQNNENSFIGDMVIINGNRFMSGKNRGDVASYVLGHHGIFTGNIAPERTSQIEQIVKDLEACANLLEIS